MRNSFEERQMFSLKFELQCDFELNRIYVSSPSSQSKSRREIEMIEIKAPDILCFEVISELSI